MKRTIHPILLLKFICVSIFLGQAWRHLRWDIPIRSFLKNRNLMENIVNLFGLSWNDYIESIQVEWSIGLFVFSMGFYYLYCAFAAFRYSHNKNWTRYSLLSGSGALLFLAGQFAMDPLSALSETTEFACQITAPLALVYFGNISQKTITEIMSNHLSRFTRPVFLIQISIALTFLGYGVYALGIYPLPEHFITITMNILPVSEEQSRTILYIAGILNVFAALTLFLPHIAKYALWYCTAIGLLTALARLTAFIDFSHPDIALNQWLHRTMFLLPNGGLPLLLCLVYFRESKQKQSVGNVKNNKTTFGTN